MRTLVFNGWAAGYEVWELTAFEHDWLFSYIEELDGLPAQVMAETDKALLVGFSMGGSMALKTYLEFPDKVAGLVLVSATPRMMADPSTDWKGMSQRRSQALMIGTRLVFGKDPSPVYAQENLERGLEFLRTVDLRERLLAQTAACPPAFPVRILQSEKDGVVHPANAAFLQRVFPRGKVRFVPGNEHVLPVSASELVDAAVAEVLAELEAGA